MPEATVGCLPMIVGHTVASQSLFLSPFCFNIFQIHSSVVNSLFLMVTPPFFINQKLNSGVNSLFLMVTPPFFIDQTCLNRDLHVYDPMTCNPAGG